MPTKAEIDMFIDMGILTQKAVDKEYDRRIAEFNKQYPRLALEQPIKEQ